MIRWEPASAVDGMNALGEIVGTYELSNGGYYGFIDQGGRFSTIADPYADNAKGLGTFVNGVTDSGELAGNYLDSNSTVHAFVYKNGSYKTYTCPRAGTGPNSSTHNAGTSFGFVDSAGAMSGTCSFKTSGYYNFIYRNGRFSRVPSFPGSSDSWIDWVTDSGESGGSYYTIPTAANGGVPDGYIYENGRFTTIEDPYGQYGIYLDGANDLGAIAGYYFVSGDVRGFLMSPIH